jgi:hypothetical protein
MINMVKIGHASSDENNKAKGGKAGDQTCKEVVIRDWYKREWSTVFRAKDSSVAEKIAQAMEQACANNNIGYDQGQRTTLYEHAKKLNWNITKINNKCECDCSSLVAVCVNAAGIPVSKDMYTGNQKKVLSGTGKFNIFTDAKYLTKADNLKRGDILLAAGHTAVVLFSDDNSQTLEVAKHFSKEFANTYTVTAEKLNIRCGAGVTKEIITTIPKNTKVKCYGYYTEVLDTPWLYVQFLHKGKQFTVYASAKYLV